MTVEHVAKRVLSNNIEKPKENIVFEGFWVSGAAQDGLRCFQDEYKRATMSEDDAKRFKRGEIDGKIAPRCEK